MDYAQDGDLHGYDDADIAEAALWEGKPSEFAETLRFVGFLDEDERGHVVIHQWSDYAGKLIAKRKADALRKRATRLGIPMPRTSGGHPADGAGTVPNPTVHDQLQQQQHARTRAGDESEHDEAATTVDATGPEQELLAALGAAATPANARAMAAVRQAYPALDHRQQAAVCAAYYAEHKRAPPSVARYAEWCKRDRGESTNGAAAEISGAGRAGAHRRTRSSDPAGQPVNAQHAEHARRLGW